MATINLSASDSGWMSKASGAANGDTIVFAPGTYMGTLDLRSKQNITITAQNKKQVVVGYDSQRQSPWASGLDVMIDASGRQYAMYFENCNGITVNSFACQNADTGPQRGGIQMFNCSNMTFTDIISQNHADAGIVGGTQPEAQDNSRKSGFTYTRCVAQGCGGHGLGMAFCRDIVWRDCAAFYIGRGWHKNVWGGNGFQGSDGKWHPVIMWSGGNKSTGCDNVLYERFWCASMAGGGVWPDWLNSNFVVRHSLFENFVWYQHNYDAFAFAAEISNGPFLVEDCLFRNIEGGGTSVWESWNCTFRNNNYVGNAGAYHRNMDRNGGVKNVLYDNNRFYAGAHFGWWGGISTDAERAARNIVILPNNNMNAGSAPTNWTLGSSLTGGVMPSSSSSGGLPSSSSSTSFPPGESAELTEVPPAAGIRDASGAVWTLVNGQIAKNGVIDPITNSVVMLVYVAKVVYQTAHGMWWKWQNNSWVTVPQDPRIGYSSSSSSSPPSSSSSSSTMPSSSSSSSSSGGKKVKSVTVMFTDGSTVTYNS